MILRKRVGGMLLALGDVYTIPALVYAVLRFISGYALWPIALISNLLPWMAIPGLVLVGMFSAKRRWVRAGLNAPIAIMALVLYGGLFIPKAGTPPCASPCQTLQVLHLNIASGLPDSAKLIALFGESQADIITLVEVSDDQAEALGAGLADAYPYRVLEQGHEAGLLSKYPIKRFEFLPLVGRSFLEAELDVDGRTLRVIVAHTIVAGLTGDPLGYSTPSHDTFNTLADMAADGPPTLLAGDFNMTDQSAEYDLLAWAGLHDSFREAGFGFGVTYPVRAGSRGLIPFLRIDIVWHTDDLRAIAARVMADAGSDHLPVWVELNW